MSINRVKRICKSLFFCFLALPFGSSSFLRAELCADRLNEIQNSSSWVLLGPSNGKVNTVARSIQGTIFIGTSSGGVFRSVDGGGTWKLMSDGLGSKAINLLKFVDGKLYAVTGDRKSTSLN